MANEYKDLLFVTSHQESPEDIPHLCGYLPDEKIGTTNRCQYPLDIERIPHDVPIYDISGMDIFQFPQHGSKGGRMSPRERYFKDNNVKRLDRYKLKMIGSCFVECATERGELNTTRLAELIAYDVNHDEWLDDETHYLWEVVLEIEDELSIPFVK